MGAEQAAAMGEVKAPQPLRIPGFVCQEGGHVSYMGLIRVCARLQEEEAPNKEEEKPKEVAEAEEQKPKDGDETKEAPPPEELEMRVYMHCEGCARKVKKILKRLDGTVLPASLVSFCFFRSPKQMVLSMLRFARTFK
jgi:hypothetical protein